MNESKGIRKPILIGAFLACVCVLAIAGTKISRLTETVTLPSSGGSLFVVVTGTTSKATRQISDTNLITSLAALPTWPSASTLTATNNSTTNATKFGLFDQKVGTVLQFFGIEQGTNTVIYRNGSNYVINSQPGGSAGASTQYLFDQTQFATNASGNAAIKSGALLTNISMYGTTTVVGEQTNENNVGIAGTLNVQGGLNVMGSLSELSTNLIGGLTEDTSPDAADFFAVINHATAALRKIAIGSIPSHAQLVTASNAVWTWGNAVSNLVQTKQHGSANLTNWSNIPTGAMANAVSTTFLTNWANSISNLVETKQAGNAALTNLVGTVARNVTNVVSLSTTNATSKPLTNSYTSGVLTLFGLEAGGNVTITPNGSNLVIAASVSGSGISTNGTQFGPSVELTIGTGAMVTNVNAIGLTNRGVTILQGAVTNGGTLTQNDRIFLNERIDQQLGNAARFANLSGYTMWSTNGYGTIATNLAVAGTNLVADHNLAQVFTNYILGNASSITNVVVTNLVDGKPLYLGLWITNGTTVQLCTAPGVQIPDAWYTDGVAIALNSNGVTWVKIQRFGTWTNVVSVDTPSFGSAVGPGLSKTTNFATRTITDLLSAVLTNLVNTVANNVTNENSAALQINSGTLTLAPGVISNIVQSGHGGPYIAINTNGGSLVNITNLVVVSRTLIVSNDATGIASIHESPVVPLTVAGTGGALTNYTFLADTHNGQVVYVGSTNTHIVALMQTATNRIHRGTIIHTNRTGGNRIISASAVTNNFVSLQVYDGLTFPITSTNGTSVRIDWEARGTNVQYSFKHFPLVVD